MRSTTASQPAMIELTGRGPTTMVWLYFATISILALWSLSEVRSPLPTVVGLALFAVVCVVLSTDRSATMSLRTTLVTITILPVIAAPVSWQILEPGGFAQWYMGSGTACLFYVSLRGRIGWAWAGFALLASIMLLWGLTTDFMAGAAFLVAKQFPILVAGTLFAIGLRNTSESIQQVTAETSARAATEAGDVAATAERKHRLAELDAFATPLLALLVSDRPLTDDDRRDFSIAEAELRDDLRARSLSVPTVVAAARLARRRGVDVVLLDDSDPETLHPDDLGAVIARVTGALDDATDGRVVARLLPPGREGVATLLVEGSSSARNDLIEGALASGS
ncbi:MAG: hypothetical protein Q8M65_07180 [Rhodoglobus sp.]|nr:hypothetical protein [Rhodoglobus sp.]